MLAHAVNSPDATPRFLHWLFSLGCEPDSAAKMILRFPNVLNVHEDCLVVVVSRCFTSLLLLKCFQQPPSLVAQLDLETAIKPRFDALLGIGVSPAKLLQGIVRGPVILGVESESLLERINYFREYVFGRLVMSCVNVKSGLVEASRLCRISKLT